MSLKPIVIATRGSALALAQARAVQASCQGVMPDCLVEIRIIKTTGDKLQTASLANAELPKGLFTKELEVALLNGDADMAVHSLKDLPTSLPAGCTLGAVGKREDPRDVLVWRVEGAATDGAAFPRGSSLGILSSGSVVATSSTRREAQVRERRPDLNIVAIRGNVGTRLRKLVEANDFHATILAAAGLNRLRFEITAEGRLQNGSLDSEARALDTLRAVHLDVEAMIPCVGQAAVGIEIREGDERLVEICRRLNHPETESCVRAERSFLAALGGGCQAAVAAHAVRVDGQLFIRGVSYLGGKPCRAELEGPLDRPEDLGQSLARALALS